MYGGSRSQVGRAGPWIAAAAALCTAFVGLRVLGPGLPTAHAEPTSPTASAAPGDPTPSAEPTAGPTTAPTPTAGPTPAPSSAPSPPPPQPGTPPQEDPTPRPPTTDPGGSDESGDPGEILRGFVFAPIAQSCGRPTYLEANTGARGVSAFDILRLRFRIDNGSDAALILQPQLQYRIAGSDTFTTLPGQPTPDHAFALELECRQTDTPTGHRTETLPPSHSIGVDALRFPGSAVEVAGQHETGANPAPSLTLPAHTATEQEFTIRASLYLPADERYEFRLTDGGAVLAGTTAPLRTADAARFLLTPGQRHGVDVAPPRQKTSTSGGPLAYPLINRSSAVAISAAAVADSIHGPYNTVTDQCSACHRVHTAATSSRLSAAAPTSTLCLTCHNGTGASAANVAADYAGATPNNPATSSYYQHDALATTAHTLASDNEFGGVSNRHAECVDCHNPHKADISPAAASSSAGWLSSGVLAGMSGVSVSNGAAATAPTYAFLQGEGNPVTLEYQLCFKCHSGFTQLRAKDPNHPSWDALDKGIEFNPANASLHPIEAQGTNQTTAMAASLSGTSPYKLWDFTTSATVRCENCHASGSLTARPATGQLPNHASANRGILLRPYRDRLLLGSNEGYSAADFALCYTCHAEAPYVDSGSPATDFNLHAYHMSDPDLQEWGAGGTSIDAADGGQSNAICAECHFRLHSTTFKYGSQSIDGSRLVSYSPNVMPWTQYNGDGSVRSVTQPTWVRRSPAMGGGGTCTLVCHGKVHNNYAY